MIIKKIQAWLTKNSVKDTEFNEAIMPFNGNEIIAFVQNGHNAKVSLKDFVAQLLLLGVSDFLNITEKYNESYISLSQAIRLIVQKEKNRVDAELKRKQLNKPKTNPK